MAVLRDGGSALDAGSSVSCVRLSPVIASYRNGFSGSLRGLPDSETKRQEPLPFNYDTRSSQIVPSM